MSLNYEYDFITEVIKLWHAPSIYVCWADHFFYYLFQDVSFLPNLFVLTFIRNQSGLCKQFFIPKSATLRAIHAYFMTCSLNINESRQVFYLSNNQGFFKFFSSLYLSTRKFEFELFLYNFFLWSYFLPKLIWLNIGMTNQFTVTSYLYYQQLI